MTWTNQKYIDEKLRADAIREMFGTIKLKKFCSLASCQKLDIKNYNFPVLYVKNTGWETLRRGYWREY